MCQSKSVNVCILFLYANACEIQHVRILIRSCRQIFTSSKKGEILIRIGTAGNGNLNSHEILITFIIGRHWRGKGVNLN